MSTRLKHILLSSNNLKKTCDFFTKGLGFSLVVCTDTFAELTIGKKSPTTTSNSSNTTNTTNTTTHHHHHHPAITLAVQQKTLLSSKEEEEEEEEEERRNRQSEKNTISLNFEVVDVDHAVKQLLELGGTLDGPIQFTSDKSKTVEKIAAMTTIDGHSIGLFEPKERKNE
ncbi:unnamed protein product [Bathycoccus prasinos]|jgi:catechol 2,3-dioxygenase-like lactoylglutathione lyase family enzyme|tara:strand:- start:6855 stop:7364 length:510 start_codon:yes stop_codon:yes gene_type:complete